MPLLFFLGGGGGGGGGYLNHIYTSMTVDWSSSLKASFFASKVWQSSTIKATRFPIPSPLWADVGTNDTYSFWFLFS